MTPDQIRLLPVPNQVPLIGDASNHEQILWLDIEHGENFLNSASAPLYSFRVDHARLG